jgi:hypothetical protein
MVEEKDLHYLALVLRCRIEKVDGIMAMVQLGEQIVASFHTRPLVLQQDFLLCHCICVPLVRR